MGLHGLEQGYLYFFTLVIFIGHHVKISLTGQNSGNITDVFTQQNKYFSFTNNITITI
jgi:hypothetical protein